MYTSELVSIMKENNISGGLFVGSRGLYTKHSVRGADIDIVALPSAIPDIYKDKITSDGIITFVDKTTENVVEILVAYDNTLEFMYHAKGRSAGYSYADAEMLYVMKLGHIHRNTHKWEKHMQDIVYMQKHYNIDCDALYGQSNRTLNELIADYRNDTDMRLGKQQLPKLNVTKDQFFNDGVTKYIDHDIIHEVVAHEDKPMYTYMQKNGEVFCYKELWDNFTLTEKVQTVLEECYVIACERCIIPQYVKGSRDYYVRASFMWALKRVCTDLTSGFFREFAIRNYKLIVDSYDPNFYIPVLGLDFS